MSQNANVMAELAAMRAKGQLNDEEFEAAKAAILNESGKTVYRAVAMPQEKFACSDTTTRPGSGLGAAILVYLIGMVLMFMSMPFAHGVLSLVIGGGATVYSIYLFFAGVKNAMREGPCPHCRSTVVLLNKEETSRACPACKHRIMLRGDKLFDVTPS